AQIHRVLNTDVEALATHGRMHVCGVAGQQDPSVAVDRGLAGRIGEPGDPGGTVDPVVCSVYGDQRRADIPQGGFIFGSYLPLGQPDARSLRILQLADRMGTHGVVTEAPLRLRRRLDLGDQPARRRIPSGKLDSGSFSDETASPVAPDEIFRPYVLSVGQLD